MLRASADGVAMALQFLWRNSPNGRDQISGRLFKKRPGSMEPVIFKNRAFLTKSSMPLQWFPEIPSNCRTWRFDLILGQPGSSIHASELANFHKFVDTTQTGENSSDCLQRINAYRHEQILSARCWHDCATEAGRLNQRSPTFRSPRPIRCHGVPATIWGVPFRHGGTSSHHHRIIHFRLGFSMK